MYVIRYSLNSSEEGGDTAPESVDILELPIQDLNLKKYAFPDEQPGS